MKLYYPKSHYSKAHRGLLFPLLKPFIKSESYTDTQRKASYGISEKDFQLTKHLEEADVVILTMAWNYYIKTKQENLAIAFVKECAASNKKVITFNAGDFGVRIPYFENLIIFRASGYKTKFTANEYALPSFIADPLKKYYQTDEVIIRAYHSKPVIGFCGQANPSLLNAIKEKGSTGLRNLKAYLGISKNEPQQLLSTSYLRASILNSLQKSSTIKTNFIFRKKYRAGVTHDKDSHQTTLEFYDNLRDSDYVVCVRGAGNFSVRFYETLAMGRIPIFINTDSPIPLDNFFDWKNHAVWIEKKEIKEIAEKVMEFHRSLSESEFINLQLSNRKIWVQSLSLKCFFKFHFENK